MFARIKGALRSKNVVRSLLLAALFVLAVVPTFAQTPVPLVIPTNDIFTSTNSWMGTFAPIISIGIGISLAIALLTFIGATIIKGIKGAGSK